ncbi:site-specific recombinase [hydrocarbon metagenome]|uniref:Site-specific recombinase n=1 Tax=hydrocarbon metagenome TaxID=938273 RepID=A0A0W8F8D8_9ZZZZ
MTLLEAWATDAKIRGMSPRTIRNYRYRIANFMRFLDDKDIFAVNKIDIRDFIEEARKKGHYTGSIAFSLASISNFYDWAIFEELTDKNPVKEVRSRYLHSYKKDNEKRDRQLISIKQAANMIDYMVDIRDKAMMTVLFKTGVRRNELLSMEVDDINWNDWSITLKPTAKRSNRVVFFDQEAATILSRWLAVREERNRDGIKALWISTIGRPATEKTVIYMISKAGIALGIHNPKSPKLEEHFSAHCCRHWFTTHLRRSGMPREFIQELRGDVRKEAIDIYDHIDREELRRSYLSHIPKLGIGAHEFTLNC